MSRLEKDILASARRLHAAGFISDARLDEFIALCRPKDVTP